MHEFVPVDTQRGVPSCPGQKQAGGASEIPKVVQGVVVGIRLHMHKRQCSTISVVLFLASWIQLNRKVSLVFVTLHIAKPETKQIQDDN